MKYRGNFKKDYNFFFLILRKFDENYLTLIIDKIPT